MTQILPPNCAMCGGFSPNGRKLPFHKPSRDREGQTQFVCRRCQAFWYSVDELWIECSNFLPEFGVDVLVCDGHFIGFGHFISGAEGVCFSSLDTGYCGEWLPTETITHWMPKPKPPNVKETR